MSETPRDTQSEKVVTLTEFNTFLWLTEAEKAAVRKRGATPKRLKNAYRNGFLMGLVFAKPALAPLVFPSCDSDEPPMFADGPLRLEWDDHALLSAAQEAAFDDDSDGDYDEDYSMPEDSVGCGPPAHGVVELDDAARAALEEKITEALAADARRFVVEDGLDASYPTTPE